MSRPRLGYHHAPQLLPEPLVNTISTLSLGTNLELCLDAGDENSWPGSGTKWLDVSGNGYDFFLGSDATATNDPTFVGTVGDCSQGTYWDTEGSNHFTYDAANEAWMNNIHKDSAAFTLVAMFRGQETSISRFLGTAVNIGDIGFQFYMDGSDNFVFQPRNGVGAVFSSTSPIVDESQWSFVALSVDEAGDSLVWAVSEPTNGYREASESCTYSSPSASAASFTFQIGRVESLNFDGHYVALAAWSRALSTTELRSLYDAIRPRIPSLPKRT